MSNKKGSIDLLIYFLPTTVFLMIVLVFFGVLFFVVEIGQSPNLVISSAAYQSSSKLNTILRTPSTVQENNNNLTIAELISKSYDEPRYKEELTKEIKFLLDYVLPRVNKGKGLADTIIATPETTREELKEARWNLDIKIDNVNFLHVGEESSFSTNYLIQTMNIPLENKRIAKVTLYLNCRSCNKEDLDFVA